MDGRDAAFSWVLALCCLIAVIAQRTAAQDTSTPEERTQWVEITHKLESSPLDDSVNKYSTVAGAWPA
jgi:hypothetical protein